jgi:hypothetical protein
MESKAALMHFCMELSKKLGIWYKSPPLPIEMSIRGEGIPASILNAGPASVTNPAFVPPGASIDSSGGGGGILNPDLSGLQALFAPKS